MYRSNLVEDDTEEILQKSREQLDSSEVVQAKYVIGCDGAHSWTRQQIGCELEGDSTDYIFGVVDIIAITDFRKFIPSWLLLLVPNGLRSRCSYVHKCPLSRTWTHVHHSSRKAASSILCSAGRN